MEGKEHKVLRDRFRYVFGNAESRSNSEPGDSDTDSNDFQAIGKAIKTASEAVRRGMESLLEGGDSDSSNLQELKTTFERLEREVGAIRKGGESESVSDSESKDFDDSGANGGSTKDTTGKAIDDDSAEDSDLEDDDDPISDGK